MPALRTEITEIVTGLAMFGYPSIEHALGVQPPAFVGVASEQYEGLLTAYRAGISAELFETAWRNGTQFARSVEGLRGRPPWVVEWKGSHRPPGYEQIPADLRVDHVYLVSCKYGSNILTNSSPMNLFDRLLADRQDERSDWFAEVALPEYQGFYDACRIPELPDRVEDLTQADRSVLKRTLGRQLPPDAVVAYREFVAATAIASSERWRQRLTTKGAREQMVWRLLRLQSAPYFVLGQSAEGSRFAFRVATPWDLRSRYQFLGFDHRADLSRGQPVVAWQARFRTREGGKEIGVLGHVEVRWSHGRFAQVPEAKVYLDTAHHEVPGYVALDMPQDDLVLFSQ